jgi:phosphoacetylglucosamine mutase
MVRSLFARINTYVTEFYEFSITELAFKVAGLVYDEVGGDPTKRPTEFL